MYSLSLVTKSFKIISVRNYTEFPWRHHSMFVFVYCWFWCSQVTKPKITLLNEWCVISFLQLFDERDFILCCKMLCVNYSGYLHVNMSQISIPLPINRELSSLKETRGSACVQIFHGRIISKLQTLRMIGLWLPNLGMTVI